MAQPHRQAVAVAVRNVSGRRRWSKLQEWRPPQGISRTAYGELSHGGTGFSIGPLVQPVAGVSNAWTLPEEPQLRSRRSTVHCRADLVYRSSPGIRMESTQVETQPMTRFYQPDLTVNVDSPFIRDGNDKLIRRPYWLDMNDHTLVMVMTKGIGANLTNDEKRAHLADLRREHLIDEVCPQEILPPEK
jgi:hypothetical protein